MTSEIRVNKIENRSGLGTVTFADTGVDLAGIVTATTFSGSGASLTSLPAAQLSGTLPAISGANLTNLAAANLTGTIADARFPATLPAASAANLTSIPAANVTGTLPALTAANLTNIPAANIVGVATAGFERSGGFPQGLNASYARITDTKGSGTQGGSFTSGAWRTRDLNTEDEDTDGIVSLSSNQFTLQAGTYYIQAQACAISVNNHVAKIQNVTDASTAILGNSNKIQQDNVSSYALVQGSFTIASAKTFELQHRCATTVNTHGFGAYHGYADNVYATVEIYKRN